jgi:hypothetical protein
MGQKSQTPGKAQQATISSFFKPTAQKRGRISPIDLTGGDDDNIVTATPARGPESPARPVKRFRAGLTTRKPNEEAGQKPRTYVIGDPSPPIIITKPLKDSPKALTLDADPSTSGTQVSILPTSRTEAAYKKWSFDTSRPSSAGLPSDESGRTMTLEEKAAKAKRRKAFETRLSTLELERRERSSRLQEADRTSVTALHDEQDGEGVIPGDIDEAGDAEDRAPTPPTKSLKKKGKPKEEIGPSGKSYTPLEKQVGLTLFLLDYLV